MGKHGDPIGRFYSFVDTNGPDGCHIWVGGKRAGRYGAFKFEGIQVSAHRFAYELAHGPVAEWLCVLHKCDNGLCVNPDHLFLGTQADNVDDMISKGKQNFWGKIK